ncbi:metallopeptidase [Aureococcus anophagefferens]|nr:metallopeptidase [Aureococcus anophagefferens]
MRILQLSLIMLSGVFRSTAGARPTGAAQVRSAKASPRSSLLQMTARAAPMALAGASVGLGAPSMGRAWASLRKPRWGFQTARHSTAVATEPAKASAPPAHPAFSLVRSETIDEYGAVCHVYEHVASKAQVLSVVADDDNKVFGITFRTPPRDSTGLPHILEHSVLCGSKNYPTKEPFVELLKGSLQTFLNAFTYPDRTCYPVASQNLEDFRNLARVYLDAVFYPRAASDETVLQQEGWHYEVDGDSKLTYSGVRAAQQALFPDNAYGVDSGGDPNAIPDLDFAQFQAFHGEFYHPTNSRIFFYGDDDPLERLELLDEYLSDFVERKGDTEVATQKITFAEPKKIVEKFPASPGDDGPGGAHMVSVNWLLASEPMSPKDELGFGMREFNTGSFPKGLSFMLGMMRNWIYDRDPVEALRFEAPLAELKKELADDADAYFAGLISKLLTSNTHRVTVEMRPDETLEETQKAEEAGRLAAIRDDMSPEDLAAVEATAAALKEKQMSSDDPEALATIPTLGKADLTREMALDLRSALDADDLPYVPLFARMLLETGVAGKYDPVGLQRAIGAKTGGVSASIMNTLKVSADGAIGDPDDLVYRLVLRGKATHENAGELYELMGDVLLGADFASAEKRVVEMLKESKARYESAFRTSGQSFASARISATLSLPALVSELTSGVSHYESVLAMLEEAQSDFPALLAKLEAIRSKVLATARDTAVINLTGDAKALAAAKPELAPLCAKLPAAADAAAKPDWSSLAAKAPALNEGFAVPTQVNYVAKGGRLYGVGEKPAGSDSVVRRFLSLDFLWNKVRVIGGAYGGSCAFNPISGAFVFSSYRDPNLKATLDNYDAAAAWMDELVVDDAELTKAVVAVIGDLDGPMTPDTRGFVSLRHYLDGTTDELRQQWRDEVLAATPEDFKAFSTRLKAMMADAKSSVFASAAAFDEANAELPDADKLSVTNLL